MWLLSADLLRHDGMGLSMNHHDVGTSGSRGSAWRTRNALLGEEPVSQAESGSHPSYLKDVVLGAYPSPQLGYKRTLLWGPPLHCWMDLESHLPRSQSLRVRSKLAGQCPPTRCST